MKQNLFLLIALAVGLTYANTRMVVDVDCIEDSCKSSDRIKTVSGSFDDDYLYMGNELVFSGATQDLVFLGKTLTFSGTTQLGLFAVGQKVICSGTTGNGIMAGGAALVIEGDVTGNNYLACKSLQLTDKATLNGNLFLACAKATLDGTVNGDLHCAAGQLVINGIVNGNVTAYGGRIIIGENGRINGNFTYGTKERLTGQELARVTGTVTLDEKHTFDKDRFFSAKSNKTAGAIVGAAFCLSFIIVGCLLLFIPAFGRLTMRTTDRAFWRTALHGLVPLLMYPAAIVLSFALIVTIPLGGILLLAGLPILFFAVITGTTLTGGYIAAKFGWNVQKRHWHFLIGAGAGAVLSIIPFVNFLSFMLMGALGWGVFIGILSNGKSVATTPVAIDGKTVA